MGKFASNYNQMSVKYVYLERYNKYEYAVCNDKGQILDVCCNLMTFDTAEQAERARIHIAKIFANID